MRLPFRAVSPVATTAKALVEGESFDAIDQDVAALGSVEMFLELCPDGGGLGGLVDTLHHGGGRFNERVERKDFEDRFEEDRDAMPVSADDAATHGDGGKIGVSENNFIAVTHLGQDKKKFGGNHRVDTFKHRRNLSFEECESDFQGCLGFCGAKFLADWRVLQQ
jgi:hypothetical protein